MLLPFSVCYKKDEANCDVLTEPLQEPPNRCTPLRCNTAVPKTFPFLAADGTRNGYHMQLVTVIKLSIILALVLNLHDLLEAFPVFT